MANTILERIQERYPGKADDARNIAEALAMAYSNGGRGAGAISDQFPAVEEQTEPTEPSEPGGDSLVDPEPANP